MSILIAPPSAGAPETAAEWLRDRLEALPQQTESNGAFVSAAPDVVHAFYEARGFADAWDDARQVALDTLVSDARSHGLDPADYLVAQLRVLGRLSALTGAARADADVLLTESFLRFAYHYRFGKVDPGRLEPSWNYGRNVSAGGPFAALERILGATDFAGQFSLEMGHGSVYQSTRLVLARYRNFERAGGWERIPGASALKPGESDPRVPALRKRLAVEGYLSAPVANSSDLRFDIDLEAAVAAFQAQHGLEPDGVVGPRTWEEVGVSADERVQQLRINLERLRWVLVERAERFVAVNIAGFRVYYIEDDVVRWSTRAVVGRPYRESPVFRAQMKYLVLNPDWTVPPTILRRDVLPAIRRDPHYLASHTMDVIDSSGSIVNPSNVDWSAYPPRRFPHLIRQRAGPANSLGHVKFMFPNPHFVFLHDTPAKNLFEKQDRDFSSGCIRIENPLDLAEILLQSTGTWSRSALEQAISAGTTRTIFLAEPVPVMLQYLTAIAFDGGRDFSFYRDVYRRDAKLRHALEQAFTYIPPAGMPEL